MINWLRGKTKSAPAAAQAPVPTVAEMRGVLGPQNSVSWGGLSGDTWEESLGGGMRVAGQMVNETTAMRVSAVYACVSRISGAAACSPVKTYQGDDQTRVAAPGHALSTVLRLRPNMFMTASTFWKTFVSSKLLQGNGYAIIIRNRMGAAVGLFPVMPRDVSVYFAWELGLDARLKVERNRRYYAVTFPDGAYRLYDQDDMLHVPNLGLSTDGKTGLSTLNAMRQAAGLALAAEESSASFFQNGMQFDKAITYPNKMSPDAQETLRKYWTTRHAGASNAHIPPILTEGGDIKAISMSAADAQLLDSRKFSVIDICRFFGVPPVMIGETEKTSSWGSGVEQMARWFAVFTMNEHFTAIEQELSAKLFRTDGHFAEFDESELLRGDTKTRADYFKAALGGTQNPGWMDVDEVRAAEGMPPRGDTTLYKPVPKQKSTGKGGSDAQ